MSCFLLTVSHANYPGGEALAKLHQLETVDANVTVHIDVAAAQTGVSRFGQLHHHWRYDKTENLRPGCRPLRMFTHLIVEASSRSSVSLRPYVRTHEIQGHVEGFSHIRSSYIHFPPIRIKYKPSFFILKNKQPPKEPNFDFALRKYQLVEYETVTSDSEDTCSQDTCSATDEEIDFEFTNHFQGDGELQSTATPNDIETS